jgi:hypothetical protein
MSKNVSYEINQSINLQRYHLRSFRLSLDLGRAAASRARLFVIICGLPAL